MNNTILPRNVLYYGVDQPLPEQIPLQAGPLRLFFENGDLRHIRYRDREILRRVYVALRDRNWGTVRPQISRSRFDIQAERFHISFDVVCQQNEIDFRWRGEIHGSQDGSLLFRMDGESHAEFLYNRIGFCVLHPASECAGQACEIEHTDDRLEQGAFPLFIAPHQPFKDLRAITHEVIPGLRAEVRMEGDTFEMEDQRNWTDSSFKTYCRPLALPFPVLMKVGERVRQKILVKLEGARARESLKVNTPRAIDIGLSPGSRVPIPALGLGLASHGVPLTRLEAGRLNKLGLAHLRLDLWLGNESWQSTLQRGVAEAELLDCALEIALHLTDNAEAELRDVRSALDGTQAQITRWITFQVTEPSTNLEWAALARKILGDYDSTVPFGCGADSNFSELNRWHAARAPLTPAFQPPDFTVYAANPQVHAFDNLSLVENLAGLGHTARSARRIADGKPVIVSPLTLKPRFNAVATAAEPEAGAGDLPTTVDPRQMSLFGAGWTLGAFKYLFEHGASSVTCYETTGWRGVMESERGSPLPEAFRSLPGMVFPLYHVLADVGEFAGGRAIRSESSDPLKIETLALQVGDQRRLMAANLTGVATRVRVLNLPRQVQVKILDESSIMAAMLYPETYRQQPCQVVETENHVLEVALKPYAILRVDSIGGER